MYNNLALIYADTENIYKNIFFFICSFFHLFRCLPFQNLLLPLEQALLALCVFQIKGIISQMSC